MMFKSKLKSLVENPFLQAFLVIAAIAGLVLSIYAMYDKKVKLQFSIISSTNVLDLNENLGKLEIFYDSTNLKETEQNLKVITIKVQNYGDKDILKEYYDSNDPVGIKIISGAIIEKPQVLNASSDYLKKNIQFENFKKDAVYFQPSILEPEEYFTFKMLILHSKNVTPIFKSFGKVAGQKEIKVIDNTDLEKNEESISQVTKRGIVRFFWDLGIILLIVVIFISVGVLYTRLNDKFRRRGLFIKNKVLKKDSSFSSTNEILLRFYSEGPIIIRLMKDLANNLSLINIIEKKNHSQILTSLEQIKLVNVKDEIEDYEVIHKMKRDGVIEISGNLFVHGRNYNNLGKVIFYLDTSGKPDKYYL